MSYFDDNENRIIYGRRRRAHKAPAVREKWARKALAAPPGSELARARIEAHAAFDPFWKSGRFSRGVAYEWLAVQMKLPVQLTHMVLFDVDQCRRVVEICKAHPLHAELVAADFEDLTK